MSKLDNYAEVKDALDEIREMSGNLEFDMAVTTLMTIGGWAHKKELLSIINEYNSDPEVSENEKRSVQAALMICNVANPIELLTYVKLECPLWTNGIEPARMKKIAEDVINAGYRYCKDPRVDTFGDWKKLLEQQYGITEEEMQQILYLDKKGKIKND